MFLVNSHNPHFSATANSSGGKLHHHQRHTFSRSYGVNLPSSLTRVLSRALGYSPRPPESVCGTDTKVAPHAAFLGSLGSPGTLDLTVQASSPLGLCGCGLSLSGPHNRPTSLNTDYQSPCRTTLLRPRLLQCHPWWCRNINLLPITYASRPRLRIRLTRGRIILPQETLGLRRPSFSLGLSLLMPA